MKSFDKAANILFTISILSGTLLSGCGSTPSSNGSVPTNTAANTTASSSSKAENATLNIKDGTTKLLALANQLKAEITSGDQAKVKEDGPKLEDTWSSFEDSVKPKYPDLYAKVEQYLDPTVAGSKANPGDKQTLQKLDNGLIQALTALSEKVK